MRAYDRHTGRIMPPELRLRVWPASTSRIDAAERAAWSTYYARIFSVPGRDRADGFALRWRCVCNERRRVVRLAMLRAMVADLVELVPEPAPRRTISHAEAYRRDFNEYNEPDLWPR